MTKTLFLGGARSGKSRLAQAAAERHEGKLLYLATAEAGDDEMVDRVAKHRADRAERWTTIECPVELPAAVHNIGNEEGIGAILIDCLTLWLSNLMLGDHDIAAATNALLDALAATPCPVLMVSNEVGLGLVPNTPLGRRFRDEAGRLNQAVAAAVDEPFFVVAGMVIRLQADGS